MPSAAASKCSWATLLSKGNVKNRSEAELQSQGVLRDLHPAARVGQLMQSGSVEFSSVATPQRSDQGRWLPWPLRVAQACAGVHDLKTALQQGWPRVTVSGGWTGRTNRQHCLAGTTAHYGQLGLGYEIIQCLIVKSSHCFPKLQV